MAWCVNWILLIVDCKYKMAFLTVYKPNFHAKNIIWLKFTINYSLFKLNYNWWHCSAISLTVMLCVITKRVRVCDNELVCKQCDWLSHARQAPFPFPLFLFPALNIIIICKMLLKIHICIYIYIYVYKQSIYIDILMRIF